MTEPNGILYEKAPITQAVFELRYAESVPEKRLELASERVRSRYISSSREDQYEASLDFQAQSSTFKRVGPLLSHASADQADSITLMVKTIVWTRLAPYEGWAPFMKRMAPEIRSIMKAIGDRQVSRLGLRYINRIDVPPSSDELCHYEDYLNYRIDAGPIMEPSIAFNWAMRAVRKDDALGALVQSATVEPEIPGLAAFTFDIDVYAEVDVPQTAEGIIDKLERMRFYKNEIFEAGITQKARELYA